ncbi:MAG: hypothetical protein HY736_14405 [Verrucomicrobia bacterium]|nr:hypothetical protein [Verrucomicrobiota bacterium]
MNRRYKFFKLTHYPGRASVPGRESGFERRFDPDELVARDATEAKPVPVFAASRLQPASRGREDTAMRAIQ